MQKSVAKSERPTTMVSVVTMEEVPLLDEAERAALIASFRQAESEAAAGAAKPFDREAFRKRFLSVCSGDPA